jgi:cytochrome c oxidase assembly factor CtaG
MMTNFEMFAELWYWRSPAWWITLAASSFYFAVVPRRRASFRRMAFFAISAGAFLVALASPLAVLASRYLFSAHMAQHLLLLQIVPLCAVLAWPPRAAHLAEGHPQYSRPTVIPIGWMAGVGAMWFWHIPALCTASMRSPLVFGVQIASLIAAGTIFWWPVFGPSMRCRMAPNIAAVYLFAGCVGCSLLGIYVAFSPVAVCPLYCVPTADNPVTRLLREHWGLNCRVDQQVGGLLMWVPACMVYLAAILASLSAWYHVPNPSLLPATE